MVYGGVCGGEVVVGVWCVWLCVVEKWWWVCGCGGVERVWVECGVVLRWREIRARERERRGECESLKGFEWWCGGVVGELVEARCGVWGGDLWWFGRPSER